MKGWTSSRPTSSSSLLLAAYSWPRTHIARMSLRHAINIPKPRIAAACHGPRHAAPAHLDSPPLLPRRDPQHEHLRFCLTQTRTTTNASVHVNPRLGHSRPIPAHVPSCRIGISAHSTDSYFAFSFAVIPASLFKTPPPSLTHSTRTGTNFVQTSSKPHHFGVDSV